MIPKKNVPIFNAIPILKHGFFVLISLCITALSYGQNNIGDIDDRSSTDNYRSVDGWGEYPVTAGSSTDVHDPRIERKNLTKIKPGDKRTFEATYRIVNADNTTIAQILNRDQSSSDRHKPVVFIIAEKSGSNWKLRDQGFQLGTVGKNEEFKLRIDTYYNSNKTKAFSDIYINGDKKETKTHARVGDDAQMRYGNYHHGDGRAVIRVKNVTWETTTNGGGNPSNDNLSSLNAPGSVQRGNTVSVKVNYTASTNRDVYALFQLDESPYTTYVSQKKDVSAGSGTLTFNLNIPSNVPVANNKYQVQTFITTNGGQWSQRLDNESKANIDVTNGGGNNNTDDIVSVSSPGSVQRGTNVSVNVDYSASTSRDVYVIFQLDQSPWTAYAQQKQDVSAGSGTLTFNLSIPSNVPVANNNYQFQTFITTNGGQWNERLDNITKANVDVTNNGGGNNNSGDDVSEGIYRFKNAADGTYLDADGGGKIKVAASNGNPDQEWGLHATDGGYYNIDSRFNGRGLIASDPNGIIKWSTTGPTNTLNDFEWKAVKLSNGNYRFENRTNGRKYLRYNGSSGVVGYSNTADKRSEWVLTRISGLKANLEASNERTIIAVYPNPASAALNISLSGLDDAIVSIFNMQGQRIGRYNVTENLLSLNVSSWSRGVYLIHAIGTSGEAYTNKLLLE